MDPEEWIDESFLDPAMLSRDAGDPSSRLQSNRERFGILAGQKKPKYTPEAYEYVYEDTQPLELPSNYRERISRLSLEGERDPAELEEMDTLLLEAEKQGWMTPQQIRRIRLDVNPRQLKKPGPLPTFEQTAHPESGTGRKPRKNRQRLPVQSFQHKPKIQSKRNDFVDYVPSVDYAHTARRPRQVPGTKPHKQQVRTEVQKALSELLPGVSDSPFNHPPIGKVDLKKMVHDLVREEMGRLQVNYEADHRPEAYFRETPALIQPPIASTHTWMEAGTLQGEPSLRATPTPISHMFNPTSMVDQTPSVAPSLRAAPTPISHMFNATSMVDQTPSVAPTLKPETPFVTHFGASHLSFGEGYAPLAESMMKEKQSIEMNRWVDSIEPSVDTTPWLAPTLPDTPQIEVKRPEVGGDFDFNTLPTPTLKEAKPLVTQDTGIEISSSVFDSLLRQPAEVTPKVEHLSTEIFNASVIPEQVDQEGALGASDFLLKAEHTVMPLVGRGEINEAPLPTETVSLKHREAVHTTRLEAASKQAVQNEGLFVEKRNPQLKEPLPLVEGQGLFDDTRLFEQKQLAPDWISVQDNIAIEPAEQLISEFEMKQLETTSTPTVRPIEVQSEQPLIVSRNSEEHPDVLKIGDPTDSEFSDSEVE